MCGFVGCLSLDGSPVDVAQVEHMNGMLKHRGPDSTGLWHDNRVAFAFQRLSIMDLSEASNQPMSSGDGRYKIVFNGEIYNFKELRSELQALGYQFHTTGDTEVLLTAYIAWGKDCLPKLNGMWSFLIYDTVSGDLFGSRDRFGVKPLFIYRCKEQIQFASEIKAIRASNHYRGDVNWNVAAEFLLKQRLDFDHRTFFTGIEKISPGSAFCIDAHGRMQTWSYWELPTEGNRATQHVFEEYYAIFADAIRLRMRSDVPLGVFLSGGVDSTSIVCEMARQQDLLGVSERIRAFSFIHEEFDESPYIQDTLAQVNAQHELCGTEPAPLWNAVSTVLWYQDEPLPSINSVIGFELAKLAAQSRTKVVLNGQGADETAAGYASYFVSYWHSLLSDFMLGKMWKEIGQFSAAFGGSQTALLIEVFKSAMGAQFRRSRLYRMKAGRRQYERCLANDWFERDFKLSLECRDAPYTDMSLDAQLRNAITIEPLPLYLRAEDRNSMAHGVESRLPFLDFRLVSFLFSIDYKVKMNGPWNKHIQRVAMSNRIPSSVCGRTQKMGFPVPIRTWFAGPLYEVALQILSEPRTKERGIYNIHKIQADLRAHREGHIDVGTKLFNMLQFELWMRTLVDCGQRAGP